MCCSMAQVVDAFLVLASFRGWVMLLEPVAFVAGFDDVAVMSEAVEQDRGHIRIGNSTTRTRVFSGLLVREMLRAVGRLIEDAS